jgi:hypothetical protein
MQEEKDNKSLKDLVLYNSAWFHILYVFSMMILNVDWGQPVLQY